MIKASVKDGKKMKKLSLLIVFTFLSVFLFAQNKLGPSKITVYKDGAQVILNGILRFKDRVARVPVGCDLIPETIEVTHSEEFKIFYVKILNDSIVKTVPVQNWYDVLESNKGQYVVITYLIGQEYDEVAGEVRMINRKSRIFMLQEDSGDDLFIPIDQVQQVLVDSIGQNTVKRKVPETLLEVKMTQEMPFAPLEVTGLLEGITWNPSCKLRLVNDQLAKYQLNALVDNKAGDFEEAEIELAGTYVMADVSAREKNQDRFSVGKTALKNGEKFLVNLKYTQHEYQDLFTCDIPWDGIGKAVRSAPQSVFRVLKFVNPIHPSNSCESMAVLDAEARTIGTVNISTVPPEGLSEMSLGAEEGLRIQYTETIGKKGGKTVKIDDLTYMKTPVEGTILVINQRPAPANIRVSRKFFGEKEEAKNPAPRKGHHTWNFSLNVAGSKELKYTYFAYELVE